MDPKTNPQPRNPGYKLASMLGMLALAVAIAILIFAASRLPYFPTDLAIARGLQSRAAMPVSAAKWITATAEKPWWLVLLALTAVFAWVISGWRAALLAIPVFFGLLLFGIWLSPHVAQPRPSPELIKVIGNPKGYAFPSILGLIYAATFGYIGLLAARRSRGASAIVIPILAAAALILGGCARIVLGAHWPSDVWTSYLMGLFWIGLLMPLSARDMTPRRRAAQY
ncbi:MAG: phosphatase PAP2 family protein [Candidatus Binatus sp.]|jgi:membrane-associated phospholipid phosphatase|uniref:phosphatase PAP2 family protein n=1 Tax=Candidatus Binatus sp. TaxID=2811406 RepID=UPI003D13EEE0